MKRVHRAGVFIKCSDADEVSEQSKMRWGFLQDRKKILHFRERGRVECGIGSEEWKRGAKFLVWGSVIRVLIQANDRSGLHIMAAIYGEM